MGSFNIQCYASKQVIAEGEACRVAVLLQSSTYSPVNLSFRDQNHSMYGAASLATGTSAFWKPATAFMEATYADYGQFKLANTDSNRIILADLFSTLYRGCAVAAEGENSSHEPAFNFKDLVALVAPKLSGALAQLKHFYEGLAPESLDFAEAHLVWQKLEEGIYRNRVFCADTAQALRPVKIAAVHEVAFRNLIGMAEGTWFGSGLSYAREAYFEHFLGQLKVELATVEGKERRFVKKDSARECFNLRMRSSDCHPMTWPYYSRIYAAVDQVIEANGSLDDFLASTKDLLDSLYALKGLDDLNIAFEPYLAGGQDYDNTIGKTYAAFVTFTERQVSKARQSRYNE